MRLKDLGTAGQAKLMSAIRDTAQGDQRVSREEALAKLKPLLSELKISSSDAWDVVQDAVHQLDGVRVDADAVAVLAARSATFELGNAPDFVSEVLKLSATLQRAGFELTARGSSTALSGQALIEAARTGAVELTRVRSKSDERVVEFHGVAGSVEELALLLRQRTESVFSSALQFLKKPSLLEELVAVSGDLTFTVNGKSGLSGTEVLTAIASGQSVTVTKVSNRDGDRMVETIGVAGSETELRRLLD